MRYADHKFTRPNPSSRAHGTGRRTIGKADYQARGVLYLPESARFSNLLQLPEGTDIGKAINDAMKAIEAENDDLKDVLPRTYNRLEKELLVSLLKTFSETSMDIEGDAFGKIYEYFLGKFAMSEGANGGEFFTPEHRQTHRGSLSSSTVESTTRLAPPWGIESGEARCEAEPELHAGVHAEMIEQKQCGDSIFGPLQGRLPVREHGVQIRTEGLMPFE